MIFITQGHYSEHAMAGTLKKPEDRAAAIEKLLDAGGIKLLGSDWTFGEHDFLFIVEAEKRARMDEGATADGLDRRALRCQDHRRDVHGRRRKGVREAEGAEGGFSSGRR